MKTTTVKLNELTGEQYFDLQEILEGTNIDPNLVDSCNMEAINGWVRLTLYNVNGKVLEVKEKK
jgi:hypothetical protein